MCVEIGRANWLDWNSTLLNPYWLGLLIQFEVVEFTKLDSCLVVFGFGALKHEPLPNIVSFTQTYTQNYVVNFKYIETV